MKYIYTENAPKPVGPYTQAIESNGFIYVSGQVGIDPKENKLVEGFEAQTHQVMKNLQTILQEAGSDLDQIVKATVYLVDINDYPKMNEIYGQYFINHKPARAAFAVAKLPANSLIEIEVIAQSAK